MSATTGHFFVMLFRISSIWFKILTFTSSSFFQLVGIDGQPKTMCFVIQMKIGGYSVNWPKKQ